MTIIQRCAVSLCALLFLSEVLPAQSGSSPHGDSKEEIYVIRSVRISRTLATEYCAQSRTGFADASFEDQYIFHAVTTRVEDGAVIDPLGNKTASLHACIGKTTDPNLRNFYGEGEIAGKPFRGTGKCTTLKTEFPEPGLSMGTCFLELDGLKAPYGGGLLTTNTLLARNATGEQSDPPGYVQPSIATVRLWMRRKAVSREESSKPADKHAVLVDNIGTYSRKISTNSPIAQKFFDQGLRLVYGYYFPEAIASFEEAQRYDLDHPMLDWGLALAMGPNPNSRKNSFPDDPHGDGKKAMANARAHLNRATPAERAQIEALSVGYDAEQYPDRAVRDEKFISATKSVLDRFPDDMEAQFLFADAVMIRGAWQYWRRDGSPLPDTNEAAAALEHILTLDPNHPGAVHLYVHLFEASAEPERALPHADRLESTMPKAGHMVHMPSHIYIRLGQYEKAAASNERSVAADRFFLSQWGDLPFPQEGTYHTSASTHAPHALDVLRQAALLEGNYARALQAAHQMAGGHSLMAANPRQQRLPPAWLVHKAFGRWQALLAEPAPAADRLYLNAAWRYFRGSSFAGLGDFEKADSELQELSAIARDPALKDVVSGANSAPSLGSMLASALTGEIAMRRGRYAEAVTAFEQTVAAQDALNYDEPPDWLQPMRLYLGAALLKVGRPKDAEAVYREELHNLHENGWALFGLWQSVQAQGRTTEAREIRERFERAWKNADVVLNASVF